MPYGVFKLDEGVQVKLTALPVAVNVVLAPTHMVCELAWADTSGGKFTVMVAVVEAPPQEPKVPSTVYVVVVVGVAVTDDPMVVFKLPISEEVQV